LGLWRAGFAKEVEDEEAAVELEGHEGGGYVGWGGADVVEETGEEVGFVEGGGEPGGEGVQGYCYTWGFCQSSLLAYEWWQRDEWEKSVSYRSNRLSCCD